MDTEFQIQPELSKKHDQGGAVPVPEQVRSKVSKSKVKSAFLVPVKKPETDENPASHRDTNDSFCLQVITQSPFCKDKTKEKNQQNLDSQLSGVNAEQKPTLIIQGKKKLTKSLLKQDVPKTDDSAEGQTQAVVKKKKKKEARANQSDPVAQAATNSSHEDNQAPTPKKSKKKSIKQVAGTESSDVNGVLRNEKQQESSKKKKKSVKRALETESSQQKINEEKPSGNSAEPVKKKKKSIKQVALAESSHTDIDVAGTQDKKAEEPGKKKKRKKKPCEEKRRLEENQGEQTQVENSDVTDHKNEDRFVSTCLTTSSLELSEKIKKKKSFNLKQSVLDQEGFLDLKQKTDEQDGSKKKRVKRKPKSDEADITSDCDVNVDENEETGTWVQCSINTCEKWRYLADVEDPCQIPENWNCSMSNDQEHNSCDKPEVNYDENNHIYTKFTLGSVVWAKVFGYPWWPAMIECDPDSDTYFQLSEHSNSVPLQFHVSFLDQHVTRSWVKSQFVTSYSQNDAPKMSANYAAYGKDLKAAVALANQAIQLNIKDRLTEFGFSKRYNPRKRLSNQEKLWLDGSKISEENEQSGVNSSCKKRAPRRQTQGTSDLPKAAELKDRSPEASQMNSSELRSFKEHQVAVDACGQTVSEGAIAPATAERGGHGMLTCVDYKVDLQFQQSKAAYQELTSMTPSKIRLDVNFSDHLVGPKRTHLLKLYDSSFNNDSKQENSSGKTGKSKNSGGKVSSLNKIVEENEVTISRKVSVQKKANCKDSYKESKESDNNSDVIKSCKMGVSPQEQIKRTKKTKKQILENFTDGDVKNEKSIGVNRKTEKNSDDELLVKKSKKKKREKLSVNNVEPGHPCETPAINLIGTLESDVNPATTSLDVKSTLKSNSSLTTTFLTLSPLEGDRSNKFENPGDDYKEKVCRDERAKSADVPVSNQKNKPASCAFTSPEPCEKIQVGDIQIYESFRPSYCMQPGHEFSLNTAKTNLGLNIDLNINEKLSGSLKREITWHNDLLVLNEPIIKYETGISSAINEDSFSRPKLEACDGKNLETDNQVVPGVQEYDAHERTCLDVAFTRVTIENSLPDKHDLLKNPDLCLMNIKSEQLISALNSGCPSLERDKSLMGNPEDSCDEDGDDMILHLEMDDSLDDDLIEAADEDICSIYGDHI